MNKISYSVAGQVVLLNENKIVSARINIENGKIKEIVADANAPKHFILPGFVDSHIHIESSMLVPSEFARMAVKHGTVATVSDPHEIANVLGIEGVEYMLDNAKKVPFKFYFGAPSCVPATAFETAGANLGPSDIQTLLEKEEIVFLAEMMNFPGVLHNDPEVIEKLNIAKKLNKVIDGHAPGLRGEDAKNYIDKGITTDHECVSYDEGKEKIEFGMKVLIREGSAAKNFDALIDLLKLYPDSVMFCSDDKHPHDLIHGHINLLAKRAVEKGLNIFNVLKAAILNPIKHYTLEVGLLEVGDPADFIIVDDLENFNVSKTYIDGQLVYSDGETSIERQSFSTPNNFTRTEINESDIKFFGKSGNYRVIEVLDGQLVTHEHLHHIESDVDGMVNSIVEDDILKMVVASRYDQSDPALAFTKGYGLKRGAIASSVAHDSHNIIAVGTNDKDLLKAINLLIKNKGGIALVDNDLEDYIALPVAGLMSTLSGEELAIRYQKLYEESKNLGSRLYDPFMMLSFCALLVIPELKLSDKGLFDVINFTFANQIKN